MLLIFSISASNGRGDEWDAQTPVDLLFPKTQEVKNVSVWASCVVTFGGRAFR